MKILICGVGSIGERHIKNIMSIGYNDIILYRSRNNPLRTISNKFPTYVKIEDALAQKPDIAFICNPTYLHMEIAIKCANNNCNIFIEKPVSHNLKLFNELESTLRKKNKIVMVGYMMRYHPCVLKMQEWIQKNRIGNVVSFNSTWGEYLPNWHPWEDYRNTYAALDRMGGGPTLTLSHELDTALWLFGDVDKVLGLSNFNSDLEIDTEHAIDILISFKSGVTANIHLDYIQNPPKRYTEIIGTFGRIEFDYYASKLLLYSHGKKEEIFDISTEFERNDMFVDEIRDFIKAVELGRPSPISIKDGFRSVAVALDAKLYEKI